MNHSVLICTASLLYVVVVVDDIHMYLRDVNVTFRPILILLKCFSPYDLSSGRGNSTELDS
jgi:hypothetical protein